MSLMLSVLGLPSVKGSCSSSMSWNVSYDWVSVLKISTLVAMKSYSPTKDSVE